MPRPPSERRDEQLSLFLDLVQEINHGATPEHVFSLVADALRGLFGIDRFAIVLVQPDGSLAVTKTRGLSDRYMDAVHAHLADSPGARALADRRPMYIPDASADPEFWPLQDAARDEGFRTVLIVPLFSGAETLGYLLMYHDETRDYTPAEIALAQAMAQQAGFAIQHGRLYATTEAHRLDLERRFQQRVAEADAIDDIILRISSSLDLTSTLQSITDAAASLCSAPTAALYLRESDGKYRAMAAHGVPLDRLRTVVLTSGDGLLSEMIRTKRPVQTSNFEEGVQTTPAAYEEARRTGTHATLGAPLLMGDDCVGALYVGGSEDSPFPPETVRIMLRLASFAQVAVQNAQRFSDIEARALQRERSRSHLLAELLELSVFLNSDLSIATLLERVVEAAMALVGARSGTLGLVEGEKLVFRRFHMPDGWIDFDVVLRPGEGAPGHVWETLKPYISNDCESDPRVLHDVQERIGFHRLATVPVLSRDGTAVGTLGVYDPVIDRDFGQEDIEALQLLAHQGSIAIENARLGAMKDAFLSIVSHELKTPVTSIKGFTQMLQRRLSQESLETGGKYLQVINQQADRLTILINDLLDLSRIQTGRFQFDIELLDYAQLVRDVGSEMQLITPNNLITVAAPESTILRGNADRLRQVLVNLIDNAVKYGPAGGPIDISVERGDGEILTRVRDRGTSLPAEEQNSIFNPYYQLDRETHIAGLGLGLYITRQIVEAHTGRIWVDAADTTTFCFTIPAVSD